MTSAPQTHTYQIAEEYLVLHTTSSTPLCPTLDKYTPFFRPSLPSSAAPILEVWDNQYIPKDITDQLLEEVADQGFRSRVYKLKAGGYGIDIRYHKQRVSAWVSEDWHQLHLSSSLSDELCAALSDRLIMIAFSVASAMVGCIKVHASVVELSGKALVLMGVSGTGKSTHSRLWLQYISGCSLLNDDEPIVRLTPSGQVRVYGCPWSGSTPCYRDVSAEVSAFVLLKQAPANDLRKLSGRESFAALYTSCAMLGSEPRSMARTLDSVTKILGHIPVYHLDNRPEYAAVQLTHSLLTNSDGTNQ